MPVQRLKRMVKRVLPYNTRHLLRTLQHHLKYTVRLRKAPPPPPYDIVYVLTVAGL